MPAHSIHSDLFEGGDEPPVTWSPDLGVERVYRVLGAKGLGDAAGGAARGTGLGSAAAETARGTELRCSPCFVWSAAGVFLCVMGESAGRLRLFWRQMSEFRRQNIDFWRQNLV